MIFLKCMQRAIPRVTQGYRRSRMHSVNFLFYCYYIIIVVVIIIKVVLMTSSLLPLLSA